MLLAIASGAAAAPTAVAATVDAAVAADPTASTAAPAGQSARLGAGWLARQIAANGGYVVSFGAADPVDTAFAVVALEAAGVGGRAVSPALRYLAGELDGALQSGGADAPGSLAAYVLAVSAGGGDPRHVGGTAAKNDLVARLRATQRTGGPDAGLFGVQPPTYDGAFRQGLALAALAAADVPATDPVVHAAVAWLTRQQCSNGVWLAYRADVAAPCAPADPATFSGPDTNSTSLAVQGLAAFGVHQRAAATLQALAAARSGDGGFPYVVAAGQPSDPNSTALTIQAVIALGADPTTAPWASGGRSPARALAGYQIGCAAPAIDRGAFGFPGTEGPNVFATVQAVPALAGLTLPVRSGAPAPRSPVMACP